TSDDPVVFPTPALGVASPASLTFPVQAVGTVSDPQAVTLENLGGIPLGIERVTIEGHFLQSNDCGAFIDPGGSCAVHVSFRPDAVGALGGAMTVATSGDPQYLVVDLEGAGFLPAPIVNLAPGALVFGPQEVGTVSTPLLVTLNNDGDAPLEIFAISASADYSQTNDCSSPMAAGGLCTINVVFAPTTVGDHIFGTLTVTSNAGGSPHTVSLDGQGTPNVPMLAVDDPVVEEGNAGIVGASANYLQTSAIFAVTLSEATPEIVTVDYTTVSDTAVDGEDFLGVTGTLIFDSGVIEQQVTVEILGDELLEPDEETFDLVLSNPVNAEFGDDSGRATILDDEPCLGPNLVANAGAEARPDGPGIPDWIQVLGDQWQPRGAPPEPVEGAAYFFSGTTEDAELVQNIDVSAYAETIGRGHQIFVFDAWVRTLYEKAETARIVVEYRDWWNGVILDVFDTGFFGSPAEWLRISDERPAPPGTTWIRIRLISASPGDAYFDAISLRSLRALTVGIDDVWEYEGDVETTDSVFTVRLACPSGQEVTVDFTTADGSALAGEDYFSTGGAVLLPVGQTTTEITVEVVGDFDDEGHEDFFVDLGQVAPEDAVLLDPQGIGVVFNDDFCPQEPVYWYENPDSWLVSWLLIGAEEYEAEPLLKLLGYRGSDGSHLLARELVATKLNIRAGSKPDILPVVDEADLFLVEWPPGSQPTGAAKIEARKLRQQLNDYNTQACF
ncbi:MAG: choice-of-anchor D domain-containing protein, partial [Acidobacteriota bacterium]